MYIELNTEAAVQTSATSKDIVNCFLGLVSDPNRYFGNHEAGSDTFGKDNRRELEMNTIARPAFTKPVESYGL